MLLVPVSLQPSRLHGLGVFAAAAISKGTLVWRFTPGCDLDLDPSELEGQPPLFRKVLLHYGYVDAVLGRFILCCDDARFLNHSSEPNLVIDRRTDRYGLDLAVGDIAPGEELTVDYEAVEGVRPE